MSCLLELMATVWLNLIEIFDKKRLQGDLVCLAKDQLREAIASMNTQVKKNEQELLDLSEQIKMKRKTLPKDTLKKMLIRTHRVRTCLRVDNNKLILMEGQLETMENNEVNKSVLTSLQTSAKAMHHMGLNKDLQRTDEVISELEAGMNFVHDINSTMHSTVGQMDFGLDDDSLEAELNLILGVEEPTGKTEKQTSKTEKQTSQTTETPIVVNSINPAVTDRTLVDEAGDMVST